MYYAVHKGRNTGIYNTWLECSKQIYKYQDAIYKKFTDLDEANNFVKYGKHFCIPLQNEVCDLDNNQLQKLNKEFDIEQNKIIVYTDGSCLNNGQKNAKAGIGIYFGENDNRNFSEKYTDKPTNNRAELSAILKVCDILDNDIKLCKDIHIYSDSKYSINCFTKWGDSWKKK